MVLAFIALFMFDVVVGVLVWLAYCRITDHMKNNPDAAKLVAEHVIAPLLTGKKKEGTP